MSGDAGKPRVLLVDDSKVMRRAGDKMLSSEFAVVTAEDGLDAWHKLTADTELKVVFTDLSMPNLDGYGLLAKIRTSADEGLRNLPVIVITGAEDSEAARTQALSQGATDFISKPFNSTDLLARARAHADYQRVTRDLRQHANIDPLTKLPNRTGYLERLQQDLAYARRHQQSLSLARLEIDDFKALFLKHGKKAADAMVSHVAAIIRAGIRQEDTAARVGLAGFALSLPTGHSAPTAALAERLRAELAAQPPRAGGKPVRVTLSVGVVTPSLQGDLGAEAALQACEALLQTALEAGGDRIQADLDPSASALEPIAIDALLEQLERGERAAVRERLPEAIERLRPLLALVYEDHLEELLTEQVRRGTPA